MNQGVHGGDPSSGYVDPEYTSLRGLLWALRAKGRLLEVDKEVDPHLEMAALIHQLGERPVLFHRATGSSYRVVAGICSDREWLAAGLGVQKERLLVRLSEALQYPIAPEVLTGAGACQEVVDEVVDLCTLPILTHLPEDGGSYVTAGVAVVKDPRLGRNASFHRLLRLDGQHLAARLVEGRGTHVAWQKAGCELEVAVCIGNSIAVLLAAAMSPAPGVDELAIANALAPTPVVKCLTVDLEVPAETEWVLEGRISSQLVEEGPFLDLTQTMDLVRPQPVLDVQCVTHRGDAIYQALLPGGLEHKLLMGVPREPTIFAEVGRVCECLNVVLTPGGGSWLHGVVQIRKRREDDGHRAIGAAFRGHTSLKHVLVVDDDIDVYDPAELEWAIATRLQADKGLAVLSDQGGSSLDPSAWRVPGQRSRTAKLGLDATIPWRRPDGTLRTVAERQTFRKVRYPPVELGKYLGEN